MHKVTGKEELYLVEVKIYPDSSNFRIYTLYIDSDRPIYRKKKPIFFFHPKDAAKALADSTCGAAKIEKVPRKIDCTYDFYKVFQDLENPRKKTVRDAELADCLILLLDYCEDTMDMAKKRKTWMPPQPASDEEPKYKIKFLSEWIPDEYDFYRKIFAASDYFLFNKKIDPHFEQFGYGRRELVKAMKYLIGDIVTKAVYIT